MDGWQQLNFALNTILLLSCGLSYGGNMLLLVSGAKAPHHH
jgi:hypothetical protein